MLEKERRMPNDDIRQVFIEYVESFGKEYQDREFLKQYIRDSYDLTPRAIVDGLGLLDVDYNKVSAYGHFGKEGLPWEQ